VSRHDVLTSTRVLVAILTLSVGLSLTACGGGGTEAGGSKAAKPATEAPDLANETYHGIDYANGPLTLSKGRWEAPVDTALGISGASAEWDADMSASGDLDGDGVEEHLSLLRVSGGGSGTFNYLALFGARGGSWTQLGRALEIGDRLQFVTPPAMDSGLVRIMVVTHGADDPMCCPGDLVLRRWRPGPEGLVELPVETVGRLAVGMVRIAPTWRLVTWGEGEPVPQGFEATLEYGEGRFSGSGGCNRYTVPVQDAQTTPGSLELGAVGSSRRACPEPTAGYEARYLQALGGVTQMMFLDGRLGLVYEVQGTYGTLVFEPVEEIVD
jgi:heat shock protein HslJ